MTLNEQNDVSAFRKLVDFNILEYVGP